MNGRLELEKDVIQLEVKKLNIEINSLKRKITKHQAKRQALFIISYFLIVLISSLIIKIIVNTDDSEYILKHTFGIEIDINHDGHCGFCSAPSHDISQDGWYDGWVE